MRFLCLLALIGCFGGGTPEKKGDDAPVEVEIPPRKLADAGAATWAQRVLYEARADERVEGLTTSSGKGERALVITLLDPRGGRRSLRIDAEGNVSSLDHVVSDGSRGALDDIAEDGHTRVQVDVRGGNTMLVLNDTVGGAPRTLLKEEARLLRHPSFGPTPKVVYVDEGSALGGIWRVDTATNEVTRIVPEREAATPVGLGTATSERVAYIEELPDQPARVILAWPDAGATFDPATVIGSALPLESWPAVTDSTGALLRVKPCEDEAPLKLVPEGGAFAIPAFNNVLVDRAIGKPDQFSLGVRTPGGATRVIASVQKEGAAWRWSGALVRTRLPGDLWVGGVDAAALPSIGSCAPDVPDGTWLQRALWVGEAKATLAGVEVGEHQLIGHGVRGNSNTPFRVHAPTDGRPSRVQPTNKPVTVEPLIAVAKNGAVEAEVSANAVVWRVGGAPGSVLLPADPLRKLVGIGFSPDAATLYMSDGDADGGVDRVPLATKTGARIARGPTQAPVSFVEDGVEQAAWVELWGDRPTLIAARPPTIAEQMAWELGPAGAVGLRPKWTAAQVLDGKLSRCTGELQVEVLREGDALSVQIGAVRLPLWGAVKDADGTVRLLGASSAGDPRVLADIIPDTRSPSVGSTAAVRWIDHVGGFPRAPESVLWFPAEVAAELPEGGACKLLQ